MRKAHAEHNIEVCDFLYNNGKGRYNDWVITTAFYAANHYVQHKIFPLSINQNTFKSLNSYYGSIPRSRKKSKHHTIIDLVKKHIPSINSEYRWLFDICMTARYINYSINNSNVEIARKYLTTIKLICSN